ncbi:sensor domain-containing diguanylate cyclase [Butyrivibrio sp. YAB3001]|uniref:sensor domain-containing diguanylate cyclase n=1 Tax=Butyrivibrio sp. YAB3001 TaxID=1520812 RepID=UPI0008F66109|nr:diguanylate cyclase [Butyrivibrio sp. YAB3001]SFB71458.1 PAS domain S-box-containing protein/diguanylate cyclase (GGDEF) domain-containing protein [Butyrivibrio sp. YAB3001]
MKEFDSEQIGQILDNYIGGICVFYYDVDTCKYNFLYVNDGFFRMLSVTKPAGMMLLTNAMKTVIPDDMPLIQQWIKDVISDNGSVEVEFRYVTLDGQLSWIAIRGNLYERKGSINTIVCAITDITEKKSIEEEFMTQYEFMNKLMDIGINFDYNVRNDVCEIRTGKSWMESGNMLVDRFSERYQNSGIHPDDLEMFKNAVKIAMKRPMQDSFECRVASPFSKKKQEYRWYKCNIMSVLGVEGYVTHVLGLISDIHEQKLQEIELKLRADKDSLTGLLNKGVTEELITKNLLFLEENEKKGALILLDVDDFKNVNDTLGHATGDEALSLIGKVLLRNFKGMDVVGRIGGDEFMIFMGDIKETHDAVSMAEKVQKEILKECTNEELKKVFSVSIGIVLCPDNGWDFQELYKLADEALYESKKLGKARFSIYQKQ